MESKTWRTIPSAKLKDKEAAYWSKRKEALSKEKDGSEYNLCHK